MRQVSFMTRFRNTAQQMAHEPSARMDSSTVVKVESAQSGELSPVKGSSYAYASAPSGVLHIANSLQNIAIVFVHNTHGIESPAAHCV